MEYYIFNARGTKIEIPIHIAYLFPLLQSSIEKTNNEITGKVLTSRVCYGEVFVDMEETYFNGNLDRIYGFQKQINYYKEELKKYKNKKYNKMSTLDIEDDIQNYNGLDKQTKNVQQQLESMINSIQEQMYLLPLNGTYIVKSLKQETKELYDIYENSDFQDEDKYTIKYMSKFDIDSVRGGSFTQVKLDKATGNVIEKMISSLNGQCYNCGSKDHCISDCSYSQNQGSVRR